MCSRPALPLISPSRFGSSAATSGRDPLGRGQQRSQAALSLSGLERRTNSSPGLVLDPFDLMAQGPTG